MAKTSYGVMQWVMDFVSVAYSRYMRMTSLHLCHHVAVGVLAYDRYCWMMPGSPANCDL